MITRRNSGDKVDDGRGEELLWSFLFVASLSVNHLCKGRNHLGDGSRDTLYLMSFSLSLDISRREKGEEGEGGANVDAFIIEENTD